jgi:hypothetical protein
MATFKAEAKRWRVLALSQFVEASPLLFFVVLLVIGGVCAEVARKSIGADWIYSCGMAIEIIGISFVAVEIVSARKRVVMPGFLRASCHWLKKFQYFFVPPEPVEGGLSGTALISFVGRGRIG